jgi:DNA-3-methyladenine glycosylase II
MSLRRSARVANSTVAVPEEVKNAIGDAKYTKIEKPVAAPKKRKSKASVTAPNDDSNPAASDSDFANPNLPATPLPKRRKAAAPESPTKPPPFTPTPSGATFIATSDHPLESLSSLNSRPAEPQVTNAPISTPNGSRVVAYASSPAKPSDPSPVKKRKAKETVPPDVGTLKPPTSNIDTLLQEAEAYLIKVDPKLKGLVEKHKCKIFTPEGLREVVDPFTALASSIIGQQVR